jgi:hypothetical protein
MRSSDVHRRVMTVLDTFDKVLRELGGPARVGRMTRTNASCVCNWRSKRRRFPAKFYRAMQDKLAERGKFAPAELWGQENLNDADEAIDQQAA